MDVKIYPSQIKGSIEIEPFKAVCLRAVIASAFSDSQTEIQMRGETEDIHATINCLNKLGADISGYMGKTVVEPVNFDQINTCEDGFDVEGSAPAFRFLAPAISALLGGGAFKGKAKLGKSAEDFLYSLPGVGFTAQKLPLKINGKLKGGKFTVLGSIGSQAVSGILMALPLLNVDSEMTVKGEIPSSHLVDVTISVMKEFGVVVNKKDNVYKVSGNQKYISPKTYVPEGDYGLSAYFLCASGLEDNVTILGLKEKTFQPEKKAFALIEQAKTQATVSVKGCVDLIYPLTVLACYKNTQTEIIDGARKTQKGAEKFTAFLSQLTKMGAEVEETEDGVKVKGKGELKGGVFVDSFSDAKVAMALAIASCSATEPTYLLSAECATKSYPTFFNGLVKLGCKCEVR